MSLTLPATGRKGEVPSERGYYLAWLAGSSRAYVVFWDERSGWRDQGRGVQVDAWAGPLPVR